MNDELVLKVLKEIDNDMARILEDLIHILVKKGIIRMSDFHDVARTKMAARESVRETIHGRK